MHAVCVRLLDRSLDIWDSVFVGAWFMPHRHGGDLKLL
jgi:hypothetical protein